VQGIIAGGKDALLIAKEGVEDDEDAAVRDLKAKHLTKNDVVFGIASGGTTRYVHAAIRYANSIEAGTVFLACVPQSQALDSADVSIRVLTGAEVVSGSTRLKAGTATKLVLNQVSTITMAQLGKIYGNLMVDVDTSTNTKLVERAARIITKLTNLNHEQSLIALNNAKGQVKIAIVMQKQSLSFDEAAQLLEQSGNSLRVALGEEPK